MPPTTTPSGVTAPVYPASSPAELHAPRIAYNAIVLRHGLAVCPCVHPTHSATPGSAYAVVGCARCNGAGVLAPVEA